MRALPVKISTQFQLKLYLTSNHLNFSVVFSLGKNNACLVRFFIVVIVGTTDGTL